MFRKCGDFRSCELPYKQKASIGVGVAVVFLSSIFHLAVAVLATLFALVGGFDPTGAFFDGVIEIPMRLALLVTMTDPAVPPVGAGPLAVLLLPEAPDDTHATVPLAPPTGDIT